MVMLRWWFLAVCQCVGLAIASAMGFLEKLWAVDVTHLSIVCLVVLVASSAFVGVLTKRAGLRTPYSVDLDTLHHADAMWFVSELLMGLGMAGTVLGFLIMLHDAFTGAMVAQEVMQRAAPGLATICVTTVVGLVSSMCLKAQLVNLDYLLPNE